MILFRATFQAPHGAPCRRMTFAARDQSDAVQFAAKWQQGRKLLKVQAVRELQRPILNLTGACT